MSYPRRVFVLLNVLVWSFAGLALVAWNRTPQLPLVAVNGTVLDPATLAPLSGVEVSWKTRKASTDQSGHYRIDLPPGVRVISLAAPNRPPVRKTLMLEPAASPVRLDALVPAAGKQEPKVLTLDRGSLPASHGKTLDSDVPGGSSISLADRYGNADEVLNLKTGKARLHAPVWWNGSSLAFATDGLGHSPDQLKALGVFQFQRGPDSLRQLAAVPGIVSMSKSPRTGALAMATGKELFVLDSAEPRQIFRLEAKRGFLLSVSWGPDDRVYFTVEDTLPLDDRKFMSRSRIASIRADGSGLKPDWASESQYSFRYPMADGESNIIFARFALNGAGQALWSRNVRTGETRLVAEPGLRAVEIDAKAGRLYYIYAHDLHLRNLKTGADWVIVQAVVDADFLTTPAGD